MPTSEDTAKKLLDLHHGSSLLIVPTAWDVWSAQRIEAAGFPALTIGSHPVADSLGYQDGEGMSIEVLMEATARITNAVNIPVSVDVESGYDLDAAELMSSVIAAGAAGINVEDTVHSAGSLRSPEEHAEYVRQLRQASQNQGVHIVINGRTDIFTQHGDPEDILAQGLHRLALLEEAGADSLYPVKLPNTATLQRILEAVSTPVNVTAHPLNGAMPDGLSISELSALGVKRVSFGPLLQAALTEHLDGLLKPWTSSGSGDGSI